MVARKFGYLAFVLLIVGLAMPVMAQAGGGNGGGGRGGGANSLQMRLQTIQQTLGSTDDEFAALSPKILQVLTFLQRLNAGGGGTAISIHERAGQAQNPDGSPPSPAQQAHADLQYTVDKPDSTPELIKAKLEAYRSVVAKVKEDLAAAQKDLLAVLTQKQEAQLVLLGVLN